MTMNFGSRPIRSGDWTWFKPHINGKSLIVQFEEDAVNYSIYGYDGIEVLSCVVWKGTLTASIVSGGYSQAQNDADKTDFETNFKPYANRSLDDAPSKVITAPIKNGNSANLAVDGSVTPVVFEYNPPTDYDIEIYALSFLFEDTTALSFGNKFILSGIGTLANGLLFQCKSADQSFTWQNMKRTRDVVEISEDFSIVTGTVNFLKINVKLPKSLRLAKAGTYGSADYLRVTVRDNLSSLDFAEVFFQGVKI